MHRETRLCVRDQTLKMPGAENSATQAACYKYSLLQSSKNKVSSAGVSISEDTDWSAAVSVCESSIELCYKTRQFQST